MCKSRCCSLVIISVLLCYFLYHGNTVDGQRTLQTCTFKKVDLNSVCVNVLSSSEQNSISHCLLKCDKTCFAVTFEASTGTCSLCSIQGLAVSENSTGVAFSKVETNFFCRHFYYVLK
ncbi:hypothetical protein DPMN_108173 [Dreissena polymorpha]|uniref:Uncharacterized protein n=1 Tax=Dreissena polymorpha TaxID=45954 RepID=A0A9D4QLT2_DREPO|nr:hypothetical protein DPMN_108173 [Dreissena polymorpha]